MNNKIIIYSLKDLILLLRLMNQNSKLKSPLKCSVFAPSNKSSSKIIVYNHTFNGNKLEGMHLVDYL